LEIAETPISTRLLEVISNQLLEMEQGQDCRDFRISKAISTDMKAGPAS
jgi:hypothetical protein